MAFGWHEKVDLEQLPPNTAIEVLASNGHTWTPAELVAPKAGSDEEGYEVKHTTTGTVETGVLRERLRCKGQGSHNWVTLRQHVQNHIKGLNFAYKVRASSMSLDQHTHEYTLRSIHP